MDDRSIRRISELTQLSRERALTEAEMMNGIGCAPPI